MAQTVADWRDFYVMGGGGVAALTGLLFVAMSLHVDEIRANRTFLRSVSVALYGLLFQLLFSGLMLVPGMTLLGVGIAVVAGAVSFAAALFRVGSREDRLVNLMVCSLAGAVGLALLGGWSPALYVYAAIYGATVAGLIRLCWRLLTSQFAALAPPAPNPPNAAS